MMIYNFHIYNGLGNCLFTLNEESDESTKLLYGFLYSLKSFANRISPVLHKDNHFFTFSTTTYQLLFLELPTSIKLVLVVAPSPGKTNEYYKAMLAELHRVVYVDYVVRNPLEKRGDVIIESVLFRERIADFLNKI